MGEIAEMMLDGDLCEGCGVYMGSPGMGCTRRCPSCAKEQRAESIIVEAQRSHASGVAAASAEAKQKE